METLCYLGKTHKNENSFCRYLYGWRDEHTGQKNSTATEDSAGGEENASEKNGTIPDIDMNPCQKSRPSFLKNI